jgi:hypothetical protein
MDWWTDPAKALKELVEALRRAQAAKKGKAGAPAKAEAKPLPTPEAVAEKGAEAPEEEEEGFKPAKPKPLPVYRAVTLDRILGDGKSFHAPESDRRIREKILKVVKVEGPVLLERICRKVAAFWGIDRVTQKVRERVDALIPQGEVIIRKTGAGFFFWPKDLRPETWSSFRRNGEDEAQARTAEELPPEEVANAARFVLKNQVSLPEEALVKETARKFGFHHVGRKLADRMRLGIELMLKRGHGKREGDVITDA